MNFSHLTPTRDTCKALKDAGFPQTTAFMWMEQTEQGGAAGVTLRGTNPGYGIAGSAAPTLTELLAYLPDELAFAVPHPIYGSTDRTHTLEVSMGRQTVVGYHLVGSHDVQHRTEHENAVEAAAHLYLALCAAGRVRPVVPEASEAPIEAYEAYVSEATGTLARAA